MAEPDAVHVRGPRSLGAPRVLAMAAHGSAMFWGPVAAAAIWLLVRPARGSFLRAHLRLATWLYLLAWAPGFALFWAVVESWHFLEELGAQPGPALVGLLLLALGYVAVSLVAVWNTLRAAQGLGPRLPLVGFVSGPHDDRRASVRSTALPAPRAHATGTFELAGDPGVEERAFAVVVHLSTLATAFVGPLLLHLWWGERETFVAAHTTEVLQFQLSVAIGLLLVVALSPVLFVVSPLVVLVVGLAALVGVLWTLRAAWAAWNGRGYRYPVRWRFLDGALPETE